MSAAGPWLGHTLVEIFIYLDFNRHRHRASSSPRSVESEKTCRFFSDTRFGTNRDAAVRPLCLINSVCASDDQWLAHTPTAVTKLERAEEQHVPQFSVVRRQ